MSQLLLAWTFPLEFDQPAWLWLLLLLPVVAAVSYRLLNSLEPLRRWPVILARCLTLLVLVLCLAGVLYVRQSDRLTVIFLMDRSDSVSALVANQEEYLAKTSELREHKDDRVGVISFARHARLEQPPVPGGYLIPPGRLPTMEGKDRSNLAAAMRLALASFPDDTAKRIVLLSDGNDNMGDVLNEVAAAAADGITIDVAPLIYDHAHEVFFDRLVAPTNVKEGDLVPLRMVLNSRGRTRGRIEIYRNDQYVELPPEYQHVELSPGDNHFILKVPASGAQAQRFEARFVPDRPGKDDTLLENNVATTFSMVAGNTKVLLLSGRPEDDVPLVDALREEDINVELVDVSSRTVDLLSLMDYAGVILANVPANVFTDEQHQALTHYVSNLGGGLIMTGGDESYGAGGWIGSPVAEIMPVHFEIKHRRVIPRGALVLIMHSCEIPRGNEWGVEVAKKSVDTISSKDFIGVLAYSWSPGGVNWEVPLQLATNKRAIKRRIDRVQIGDMPDFATTMRMAVQRLKATDAAQKHMIIISDGDPSPPTPQTIKEMQDEKITCSTVGIGFGSHVYEPTLRDIANKTGGTYYPCRNPKGLPQIFVKESKIVRRPLISEQPFTPQVDFALSELLTGIDATQGLPTLRGLVLTSPKMEALIPLVRVGEDGTKDPVLAHWQAGLGKTVAFTSGYWPRWGDAWVNWSGYSKLWAQIVRWSLRQDAPSNLDVYTRVEGAKGRVIIDAMDKDAGALNLLQLPAVVVRPDQTVAPLVFTQTGAGHYEAEFDVDQTGQYIANVAVNEDGQFVGNLQTGVSAPFSPEFRELATNETLLRQIVETTGGRWLDMDPATDPIFRHDAPPNDAKQPVWDWTLAWLLLPLFLLDVGIRRLASWLAYSVMVEASLLLFLLFGIGWLYAGLWYVLLAFGIAALVGWTMRFRYIGPMVESLTQSITMLGQAGQRSTESLGKLRDVRERVREEQKPAATKATPAQTFDEPAPDKSHRFDVGEEAARKPAKDLNETLGGPPPAESAKPSSTRKPAADKSTPAEDEDATSRLLRAKRRARQEMEDKDKDEGKK